MIQVLVTGLPRLLSEMLRDSVASSPELSLVGQNDRLANPGTARLDHAIAELKPDAAIVGTAPHEYAALGRTRLRHCKLAILAVAPDGTPVWNVALRTEFRPLDQISPTGLRTAIRDAVAAIDRLQSDDERHCGGDLAITPEGT